MSAHTEVIAKDPETGRFLAGNSGNGGRKRGSRNRLGDEFIKALEEDFERHGPATVATVRKEKPEQYLKVIAAVVPQQINHTVEKYDDLSDDELAAEFLRVAERLQARPGFSVGMRASGGQEAGDDQPLLAANGDAGTERRDPPVGEGEVR